jgi:hypothetical protein
MEAAAVAVRPRRGAGLARWAALGGALYTVLFVIGTILLYSGAPDSSSAPGKVIAYFSKSGNRDQIHVGWILFGLSMFFLLWFVAVLRRAVVAVDGDGLLASVVGIGGGIYIAVSFAAVGLNDGIRTMNDDTFQHRVYPELVHAADDASYLMHATGAAALGAMIIAVSLAFMWGGVWKGWAGWLGVVVGILAIFALIFFTTFPFLLWMLVVSIVIFLRPARYGLPGGGAAAG